MPTNISSTYEEYMETPEFMRAQIKALAEALEESSASAADYEKMFEKAMAELVKTADAYEYMREHYLNFLNATLQDIDSSNNDVVVLDRIRTKIDNTLKKGI